MEGTVSAIREVNVFSIGNSEKISTWSNVPYFFVRSLTEKGVKVNRVDINRSVVGKVLNRTIWRARRLLDPATTYDYFRSPFYFNNVRRKIARASRQHGLAQVNIFLTFSFSSLGVAAQPSVLFCDWTYDHYLKYFHNRQPDHLEHASIVREDAQIEGASAVFVLFPGVAEYMRERYRNPNIFYLGNVVNAAVDVAVDSVLAAKAQSSNLLFIGGKKYHEGAVALIAAFKQLKALRPAVQLDIIGMGASEFGELPAGVTCHGYLDKARPEDRRVYYSLLTRARVIVNTTPKWGAFSATLEAMHFCTPVITSPYAEFVETFGLDVPFGDYCSDNTPDQICASVLRVMDSPSYQTMCLQAHHSVREFTWSAYVDKMLAKIEDVVQRSGLSVGPI